MKRRSDTLDEMTWKRYAVKIVNTKDMICVFWWAGLLCVSEFVLTFILPHGHRVHKS